MRGIMEHLTDADVKRALSMTAAAKRAARNFLLSRGFEEIDTPILAPRAGEPYNPTFEVAIEDFGAMLADSPQIYKMLLSGAGYEKYFQFAHCFRPTAHESERHTRLTEFVQLDLELRETSLDDLIRLAETIILKMCGALRKMVRISRMGGLECRSEYGEEMRPDLRGDSGEISLVIVKNLPLTNDGITPCHHIFAKPSPSDRIGSSDGLTELTTESFDLIMNGIEIGGGDMRVGDGGLQRELMRLFNVDETRYAEYLEMLDGNNGGNSGGFAVGLERTVMALAGAEDIRRVTAFPDYYKRGAN